MQINPVPSIARCAAAIAVLTTAACFTLSAVALRWMLTLAHPRPLDLAWGISLVALFGYGGYASARSISVCFHSAHPDNEASTLAEPALGSATPRHATIHSGRPRAAGLFLAAAAFATAPFAAPTASAQAQVNVEQSETTHEAVPVASQNRVGGPSFVPLDPPPQATAPIPEWHRQVSLVPPDRHAQGAPSPRHGGRSLSQPRLHKVHSIAPGDTLWRLSQRRLPKEATTPQIADGVRKLIAANPHLAAQPDKLHTGDTVVVPVPQAAGDTSQTNQASTHPTSGSAS